MGRGNRRGGGTGGEREGVEKLVDTTRRTRYYRRKFCMN
jgi:hypothetical protein